MSRRGLLSAVGTALLVAPALLAMALAAGDAADAPASLAGEPDSLLEAIGPLGAGDRRDFMLPPRDLPYPGVALFGATYFTRPRVDFEICAGTPGVRCVRDRRSVEDNALLILPLPEGTAGGRVTVAAVGIRDGQLAYWGTSGRPYFRPVLFRGWSRPLDRARVFARAYGLDLFWPTGLLFGAAIAAVLAIAVRRAVAPDSSGC